MTEPHTDESPPRFVVGIDLGTTNSALAYVDTAEENWRVRDLAIPQLVGPGEVEAREVLPSFHYEAAQGELARGALRLPWSGEEPAWAVGFFARDHGAAVPGRLVVSAKSWLCHPGVDRTAGLLPWHGAADVRRLSPVEVSTRYLAHLRAAWDYRFAEHPLARQEVILTVPASFDEVARELTVEAALAAGIERVVLVEEPQAAFYAWINAQGDEWEKQVKAGQKILVCDIGGGTTDFTLIRVRRGKRGKVIFHRIAVGEHLILGGDNLDLALAHHVERRLKGEGKLDARQWGPLVRSCRQVKETLLGPKPPERVTVNVVGTGSRLIGGATRVELSRQEARELLVEGFLPRVELDAKPAARRSGFQEFSLPYAPDPAITRYLAAFLTAHRHAGETQTGMSVPPKHDPARPDIVLFNGGLFESPVLRERLVDVISTWFAGEAKKKWSPKILDNDRLDLAVARGAAYYGMVRRGHGVRITGGLAHSYYIGVEGSGTGGPPVLPAGPAAPATGEPPVPQLAPAALATGEPPVPHLAICLLPAGVEEGQEVDLAGRVFDLLIRQPVEFPLYVSSTRTTDPPGALLEVDPEQLTSLPPIRTVLQSGRKSVADTVKVTLHARLTEIGTLELWCAETTGDRKWRLQFDVRAAVRSDAAEHHGAAEAEGFVDEAIRSSCAGIIGATFAPKSADRPESLVKRLEQAAQIGRSEWPSSLMRSLWEALMEVETGRRISETHEARWLNLLGYCLRPGYGLAADDWRVAQTWRLFPARVAHHRNELCRAEWWILWRRIAGGLSQGQQQTLAEPLVAALRERVRKGKTKTPMATFQFGPHETAEVLRALGSLELLRTEVKLELGQLLIELARRDKNTATREACLWAIGRLGARVGVYGPLNLLTPAASVEEWISALLNFIDREQHAPFALMQLARLTGDRYRDVGDETRQRVLDWLTAHNAPAHQTQLVREGGVLLAEEQKTVFGESLPRGLRIG